jgi:hypothetical protein
MVHFPGAFDLPAVHAAIARQSGSCVAMRHLLRRSGFVVFHWRQHCTCPLPVTPRLREPRTSAYGFLCRRSTNAYAPRLCLFFDGAAQQLAPLGGVPGLSPLPTGGSLRDRVSDRCDPDHDSGAFVDIGEFAITRDDVRIIAREYLRSYLCICVIPAAAGLYWAAARS